MTPDTRRISLATIRMDLQGQHREFSVPLPTGPSRLVDLVPAACEIASQEAQANIERVRSEGKEISCKAGCGACCRQLVAISVVEAQSITEVVSRMPTERQQVIRTRFADAIRKLEDAGILDATEPLGHRAPIARNLGSIDLALTDLGKRYFQLQIPCPFLEDESCGIHPDRPTVCRHYHVTSPAELCQRLYEVPIERLEATFHMGDILSKVAQTTLDLDQGMILLTQSLEWSKANAESLTPTADGRQLFAMMMNELQGTTTKPETEK